MRRLPPFLAAVCVLGVLHAQDLRLVDRVAAPLAYLAVTPALRPADTPPADTFPADRAAAGFDALLDDPTIGHLLAGDGGLDAEAPLLALRQLRDLLVLSTGELELCLNGLLPRDGAPSLPLLLARVRLSDEGRDRLGRALTDPAVATLGREVAAARHRVYELQSAARRRPGSRIEVCLVGRDLLVTNHVDGIEQVLDAGPSAGPITGSGSRPGTQVPADPASGASAAGREAPAAQAGPHPGSLAADPGFAALRARLDVGPGTAFVHLDWSRLRQRNLDGLDAGRTLLLQGVGLGAAERIALSMRPVEGAIVTTVVVDQSEDSDGLLAFARPAAVRKLVQELPGHGIASVALSIEPGRLGEAGGPRHLEFRRALVGGCRHLGLDFETDVVPMLGDGGTCRLVLLRDDGRDSAVAFSLRARSATAARALVGAVRDGLARRQVQVEVRGRGDREILVIGDRHGATSIGAVGDAVVFGAHADLVERLAALDRSQRRSRQKGLARTQDLIQRLIQARGLDVRSVIGALEVDGADLAADAGRAATRTGGRHAGLILIEGDAIRVELISPI
jgi:hypothetical protein